MGTYLRQSTAGHKKLKEGPCGSPVPAGVVGHTMPLRRVPGQGLPLRAGCCACLPPGSSLAGTYPSPCRYQSKHVLHPPSRPWRMLATSPPEIVPCSPNPHHHRASWHLVEDASICLPRQSPTFQNHPEKNVSCAQGINPTSTGMPPAQAQAGVAYRRITLSSAHAGLNQQRRLTLQDLSLSFQVASEPPDLGLLPSPTSRLLFLL